VTSEFRTVLVIAVGLLIAQATSAQTSNTATLRVKTDTADVEVWLNGESMGRTPLTLKGLTSGKHRISLVKDGYEDYLQDVEVWADKTNAIFVVMKPRTVKLPDLPVEFKVVDAGRRSKYVGTLRVSAEALDYEAENNSHRFQIPVSTIKSVVRALSPVIGGMPTFKSANSKEVMAIRIEASGRTYTFIAFEDTREDPFEVVNKKTRELHDVLYRLWHAKSTTPAKSTVR
jgi:hypothetical protein